jgi:2-oxoglutarate dehydrogenase complex dehydrogenase (E1) component-like enzyme
MLDALLNFWSILIAKSVAAFEYLADILLYKYSDLFYTQFPRFPAADPDV